MRLNTPRDTTQYIITGADTFRLSSRALLSHHNKSLPNRNYGGARQNLEKSLRQIWQADEGCLLCQVDQAGAEALIVAHLCLDGKYRSLFKHGIKPHTYLAMKLFKDKWIHSNINEAITLEIPVLKSQTWWSELSSLISSSDDWEPTKRYYHFAKKTIHAGSYGMQANRFRLEMLKESGGQINLSLEQASKFLMAFHVEFPEIRHWHSRVLQEAKTKGQLRNLFGFPYNITHYINADDFKELIAWVPQSTVACITRQAYVKLYAYIEQNGLNWLILHDTHDSFLAQCPEGEIENMARKMKEFIEVELISPLDGAVFQMKSEAAIGKNWAPFSEIKNPDGLRKIKI